MRVFVLATLLIPFAAGLAQSGTMTRYEQGDPRIRYTGIWYPNTNTLSSDGSSTLATLRGSQAVVTFNGTGISWIGTSDQFSGYAYVFLDGMPGLVNTASATANATLYQQPLFTVRGLPPGLHTLTIEVTHSHDETTNQPWIWIDAFDVENGSLVSGATAGPGLAEQTSPAATYGGHWFQSAGAQQSGGSVDSSVDAGSWVSLNFNGTGADWIGYRDEWSGIAQVYVDDALRATVDTYLSPSKAQATVYSVNGLASGPHTLK